jgi:hypothetical protein
LFTTGTHSLILSLPGFIETATARALGQGHRFFVKIQKITKDATPHELFFQAAVNTCGPELAQNGQYCKSHDNQGTIDEECRTEGNLDHVLSSDALMKRTPD